MFTSIKMLKNYAIFKFEYLNLYLNFLLDKVCLWENSMSTLNKLTDFYCKFDQVWVNFCCSHIFVLKSFTEYNIDFVYRKSFCFRFKKYVLIVSKIPQWRKFPTKKFDQGHFSQKIWSNKFSTVKEIFRKKNWSREFSTVKEIFHKKFDQEIFHSSENFRQKIWVRKFFTVKEIFHKKFDQEIFHSSENFRQKIWVRKFFTVKEIFHKKFDQGNFPQTRKFSVKKLIKEIFHSQGYFPQGKVSSRKFSKKRFSKR